jgi:hypothetical protein
VGNIRRSDGGGDRHWDEDRLSLAVAFGA